MERKECEVCGEIIRGDAILVQIDGAPMQVCSKCARLGTEIQRPRPRAYGSKPGLIKPTAGRSAASAAPHRRDLFDFMGGDIVEDFSEHIREARTEKGWTQKDLALNIKEKEGLIRKIETGLVPEDRVRKKIEAVLEITLIESSDEDFSKKKSGRITTTLGDVMNIRKSEK